MRASRFSCLSFFVLALASLSTLAGAQGSQAAQSPSVLTVNGLGKGLVPLGGLWEFHTGDNPAWADPSINDSPGQNGWETIRADKPWGVQQHFAYAGFAWYRRHINFAAVPGATQNLAILVPGINDPYEVYWNGVLIGRYGRVPPDPTFNFRPPPHSWGLGQAGSGVLAFRFWKGPYRFTETGEDGGLSAAPLAGAGDAVAARLGDFDHLYLRDRQLYFDTNLVFGLLGLLGLVAWLRDRKRWLLLWMSLFALSLPLHVALFNAHLPISFNFAYGFDKAANALKNISLWYLLLYVMELDQDRRLRRWTFILSCVAAVCGLLGWFVTIQDWSGPYALLWQTSEGALAFPSSLIEAYPLVLIAFALKKRLSPASWLVAISSALLEMVGVVQTIFLQGIRFTHWKIYYYVAARLFTINGNYFDAQNIATLVLLASILYALSHYLAEQSQRQGALEQELKSAQELQRVLIPESLPSLPGFAITSAYLPAQHVGGDFFQLIPLSDGSVLLVLGDVSGKGLKAAMTVALIVGAVRSFAEIFDDPAEILTRLNGRLHGRLNLGFVTCEALRLSPDGTCIVATAGHPAPFLNHAEIDLPPALPLGLAAEATYESATIQLQIGDRLTLYTDGLLEARNATGELYGYDRLAALIATNPDAKQASQAATDFGQDDDITVLTVTRLAVGELAPTELTAPALVSAWEIPGA